MVSGDVNTKPFVWKAVASTRPPGAYQGAGQNAVLNAFQPRPDTRPVEWSGRSLTAASFYANPRHPAVQATYLDLSLADFMQNFPAKINGLYVLRVSYGKRDYGLYGATYPTTTIQVRGSRWYVVAGGTVDCSHATRAVSMEQLTGVATKRDVTARKPAVGQSTAPSGHPRRITTSPSSVRAAAAGDRRTVGSSGGAADSSTSASAASAATSTSHSWVLWTLGALVVLLAASLLLLATRRHRLAGPPAAHPDDHDPKE